MTLEADESVIVVVVGYGVVLAALEGYAVFTEIGFVLGELGSIGAFVDVAEDFASTGCAVLQAN